MSLPKISVSATLEEKASFLNKHYSSIPMLATFVKQGIIVIKNLDQAAMDAVLGSNNMLSLEEIKRDQKILAQVAAKSDPMLRIPASVSDKLSENALQATEGLVRINLAMTILVHRQHDTEKLVNELSEMISEHCDLTF